MVLSLPSRLTVDNREAFRRRLITWINEAVAAGVTSVTLDMTHTEELDVTGVALLTVMRERAALHGVTVELHAPTEPVRYMLILAGLLH